MSSFLPSRGTSTQHCSLMTVCGSWNNSHLTTTHPGHGLIWPKLVSCMYISIQHLNQARRSTLLTMKLTHSYRITLTWPCWAQRNNPPKVELATTELHKQPRNGFMAAPIHFSTPSPPKNQPQTPSWALLFIFYRFFFFGNMFIGLQCSTSYRKYRTVTNSGGEITT